MDSSDYGDTCKLTMTEMAECFICKDVQLVDGEPLRRFCDCKNLVAHHSCLLHWVREGQRSADRLRCSACNTEYHRSKSTPWLAVASRWQTWTVVTVVLVLLALMPYTVYRMMTAFESPPPPTLFKAAAVCFGLLSEAMLTRCLWCYLSRRYHEAKQTSFRLQPRGQEEEQETPTSEVKGHGHRTEGASDRPKPTGHPKLLWSWGTSRVEGKAKDIDSHGLV